MRELPVILPKVASLTSGMRLLVLTSLMFASSRLSAAPSITSISPPALQIASKVSITVEGGDLAANPRLLLPFHVAGQAIVGAASANRIQLDVTLDAAVPAGIYLARVATDSGVSNAFAASVDAIPTAPFAPTLTQLPAALAGDLTGGTVSRTTFAGKKDQVVAVEVEARRHGGNLNPVLRLYDARGVQVAWSQGATPLSGDARLVAKLPAEGPYTVELHDALFRGAAPGRFRLKVGRWQFADLAWPQGVQRGTATLATLVGSNGGAELIDTRQFAAPGVYPAPWATGTPASGSRPQFVVSEHPELIETDASSSGGQQLASAPVAVTGRIGKAREEDKYILPVAPGASLRIEVLAEQTGSPLDAVLSVRNVTGSEMAGGDDQRDTTDPSIEFTVPGGTSSLILSVRDLLGRGGDDFVYRLSVVPTSQADYSLSASRDSVNVPIGGRALLRVDAERANLEGAVQLAFTGLPPGVSVTGDEIAPGSDATLLVLSATQPGAASVKLTGTTVDPALRLVRMAQMPEFALAKSQPWLRDDMAVATSGASPLAVEWTSSSAETLPPGGKLAAVATVARSQGVAGPVRLSLVTSQTIPKKNVTVRTGRRRTTRKVDDEAKAIRAEAAVDIPADKNDGTMSIVVPQGLGDASYDLVIQADLLSADGKQVLATTYSLPRRMIVK